MSSLRKRTMARLDRPGEPVMVREGGVGYANTECADPFRSWLELMEVVEALCSQWPVRGGSLGRGEFRL
jgi:hypothetical protein